MDSAPLRDASESLSVLTGGDGSAAERFFEMVYGDLRALAGRYFRGREGNHTLQPTALVHEAFLRVAERTGARFENRAHFAAVCAVAMRGILADHSRRRHAAKRGGGQKRVSMTDVGARVGAHPIDALALDEALTELSQRSARQARVVAYRYFAGMTVQEVSEVLDVSRSTVEEDWRIARAWLKVRLAKGAGP